MEDILAVTVFGRLMMVVHFDILFYLKFQNHNNFYFQSQKVVVGQSLPIQVTFNVWPLRATPTLSPMLIWTFFVPYLVLSNAVQKLKNFCWPCNICPIIPIIFQSCRILSIQDFDMSCLTTVWTISSQYLTNVHCCNRCNHGQTIHPTEIFISMNLLQIHFVIT